MRENNKNNPIIGFSIGDTNGVGPELIVKVLSDNRLTRHCTPVIYASGKFLSKYKKVLREEKFNFTPINSVDDKLQKINVISVWQEDIEIQPGVPTEQSGKAAFESLKAATKDLTSGKIDALVTAPISKKNVQQAGFNFPGHTEYITKEAGSKESLMFMVSDNLKVGVVTGHIPLQDVSAAVTKDLIMLKANYLFKSLKKDFGIEKPKLAILGMNPHAGEKGVLGKEENETIIPAIEELKEKGVVAFGPYPADGFFGSFQFDKFDAVLAMYHDQGLIPFKCIAFENGVNFTAGLPVVRTSPDHGTAFDIAGKGIVNDVSFREAIFKAIDIVNNRKGEPKPELV